MYVPFSFLGWIKPPQSMAIMGVEFSTGGMKTVFLHESGYGERKF